MRLLMIDIKNARGSMWSLHELARSIYIYLFIYLFIISLIYGP